MDETFEDLLDAYARDTANGSAKAAAHERQLILDHVARLEARQITPEMRGLWDEHQAAIKQAGGALYYPSEVDRFESRLWQMFAVMMKGER